ncbi:hypothetical protein LSCM1_04099 [Leishmania martiniquensis]|uniref:AAA+ ATPase domain-containing protein n=1 Tax=Leishmania martiniquensis TaxID=1580590 RepID=A0A836HEN7_9TRYP|nr:hypothetical protein LSCM1_04099 [Leishmania martiniquensis]
MLQRSLSRFFAHLVREVDTAGFAGDFRRLHHVGAASTQLRAREARRAGCNVLFCGHHGTGKLNLLKAIGLQCEKKGQRVAFVSADNQRAARLDGLLINFFIGMRVSRDELPSQEQLEGTLERHVRLVESTFASSLPSLCNVDVLILDALERVQPTVLLSMDAVARRLRGQPSAPFGGLRVYAAADFWRLPVHPTSDTGGYLFQLEQWETLFPQQTLLRKSHVQKEAELRRLTELAFDGALTLPHMKELEELSMKDKPESRLFSWSSSTMEVDKGAATAASGDDEGNAQDENAFSTAQWTRFEDEAAAASPEEELEAGKEGDLEVDDPVVDRAPASYSPSELAMLNEDMLSNSFVATRMMQRFPRQPAVKEMPLRYRQFKRTEVGNFLVNMLMHSSSAASLGLVDALSVDVGCRVHLLFDGQEHFGVPGGAVGEVMQVRPHFLSIHFPREHRTVDVPRMRVVCYHPFYPEIRYELQQFPVFPRKRVCPMNIIAFPHTFFVNLNGRRMADTNDLGNLLAHQRSFSDFTIRNTSDFASLEGMVHEPTRIYYHKISKKTVSTAQEQWCRNCKQFVATASFFEHWTTCVRSVRWCSDCNQTVPLELLGPHREKHQVVLCLDCGKPVEWRHWEAHRISCGPMMREVSTDNQFIPLRTRQLALEMGLDKRDLHTMSAITKGCLPKPRERLL